MTRREFLAGSTAVTLFSLAGSGYRTRPGVTNSTPLPAEAELIQAGAKAALEKSLYPSLTERAYPGYFMVAADGGYGTENTWPGLDSWQMAGAYLLVGRTREVLDYFDFVQGSQRKDGNIPFAIFPGEQSPGSTDSWLRGLRFPEDVYTYKPTIRPGQRKESNVKERKWVGLFTHWQMKANPLSTLGAASYILTATEIHAALKSESGSWLTEKIASLESAGNYLLSRITANGLMSGAGFYMESPPRNQWDGITQCYGIRVFRELAALNRTLGRHKTARGWNRHADALAARFQEIFWRKDHFAEYVHPEHGVVDLHGLSDVNWAAIGLGIATSRQAKMLWPKLTRDPAFWRGDLPTHLVTKPGAYEKWEYAEPLPFPYDSYTHDVAAMGRVWYLEALACMRMRDYRRLRESVVKVCEMGKKTEWFWYERYRAGEGDTVKPVGHFRYCEYPAILIRVLLTNPEVFPETAHLRKQA
jgi:hypothetical protein